MGYKVKIQYFRSNERTDFQLDWPDKIKPHQKNVKTKLSKLKKGPVSSGWLQTYWLFLVADG